MALPWAVKPAQHPVWRGPANPADDDQLPATFMRATSTDPTVRPPDT